MKSNGIQFKMAQLAGVNVSILVSKLTQKFTAFLQEFSVLATLNKLFTLRSIILFYRISAFVREILSFIVRKYVIGISSFIFVCLR